ncbi:MAG TPA: GMC family oxidoreductase [Gemmatimonadaceae bacterium]|nr:GMC family oxidoreductase [Gemmatimonadaceae bacterium]
MEVDGKALGSGTVQETDVCIIGAGPAGLVVAQALAGRGRDVLLLESGGRGPDPAIQALNDGDVLGDAYAGLRETRHRALGGTTALWNTPVSGEAGAKYAPLSPVDFERRPSVEDSGWPITFGALAPWYRRAQKICGLGPFEYEGGAWDCSLPASGPVMTTRIYQFGRRAALVDPLVATLARATNVRLCTSATLVGLEADASGRRATAAAVRTPGGPTWSVRAKQYILAGGAVENARALLVAADAGLRVATPWLGRGFMEHPRDSALTLVPRSRDFLRVAAFYDQHQAADGTMIVGRFAVCDGAIRDDALPNASATLLARARPAVRRVRAAATRLAPLGGLALVDRWAPSGGHGWARQHARKRAFDGFTILLNLEQTPSPENRIVLGARRDALGVPVAELQWRWHQADHARLTRLREVVARELAELGRIEIAGDAAPDPNAHHHAGTTRMHTDAAHGVVDADCRVHGADNVFVAGASVFPTAGFVNPVLTIVALAARLGDYLVTSS